jgi:hypothetical protein
MWRQLQDRTQASKSRLIDEYASAEEQSSFYLIYQWAQHFLGLRLDESFIQWKQRLRYQHDQICSEEQQSTLITGGLYANFLVPLLNMFLALPFDEMTMVIENTQSIPPTEMNSLTLQCLAAILATNIETGQEMNKETLLDIALERNNIFNVTRQQFKYWLHLLVIEMAIDQCVANFILQRGPCSWSASSVVKNNLEMYALREALTTVLMKYSEW